MFNLYNEKIHDLSIKIVEAIELYSKPKYLLRVIIFSFSFNILLWFSIFFVRKPIVYFFEIISWVEIVQKLVFLLIFLVGFILIYSIINFFSKTSDVEQISTDFMRGYANKTRLNKEWIRWIIAGMISAFHTLLIFLFAIP